MFPLFFEENDVTEDVENLDFGLSFEERKRHGTFPTLDEDFGTQFKEEEVSNVPYPS